MPDGSVTSNEAIQPQHFPNNYAELVGSKQEITGSKWTTERLLSEYVRCTDGLIGKIDGSIPLKDKEGHVLSPPTSIVYLDKSARPVEWMVRKLWPMLAISTSEGSIPEKPKDYFLNIDKEDWLNRMRVPLQYIQDPPEKLIDLDKIPDLQEHLSRIRGIFSKARIDEDNLSEVWNHPTVLDGQHVLIVDEVASSGKTLKIAQMLLSRAIPEATLSQTYWAKPARVPLNKGVPVDGRMQFKIEWVPVWYHPEKGSGKGISDRDYKWPEHAKEQGYDVSRYSRLGRYVLSTPTHDPITYEYGVDTMAVNIRQDIEQIADDLRNHNILYLPSTDRSPKDQIQRAQFFNRMSFEDWKQKRDELMR